MSDLRSQQQRIRQLGRRAKWFTALTITVPAALLAGGAVHGGVILTASGPVEPMSFCVTGLLLVGSAFTFLLLREQAQKALEEAAHIRRLRAAALTPTNAGQPARTVRTVYRKVEQPWLPSKTTTGDPELAALLAVATAGGDVSHAGSSSGGHGQTAHHSAHGMSHSHSSFDHSAVHTHVHVDVSSF